MPGRHGDAGIRVSDWPAAGIGLAGGNKGGPGDQVIGIGLIELSVVPVTDPGFGNRVPPAGGFDKRVRVWDTQTGIDRTWYTADAEVQGVAWSPDQMQITSIMRRGLR